MNEYQKKMGELLEYVSENIPYYSNLIKKINNNSSVEQIYRQLPYQSKSLMRDNPDFINETIKNTSNELVEKLTGGTTGEPWCITKKLSETTKYFMMLWRSRAQFGIRPSDHFYQFGGYGEINGVFTTKQVIEERQFTELSMFHLNDEILDNYIELIQEGKGQWFFANPSALYLLALRMKDRGIKGLGKIKYIELTGERVYEHQESLIADVFDCPVSIMYGSREVTTISHRCKYGTHHVLPNVYIETIDENLNVIDHATNGGLGEIVITSFIDYFMPFIKYRTGDYAIIQEVNDCPCGEKGQGIEKLLGRTAAYVEIYGNKVHMEITYYLMSKYNLMFSSGIRQFEVTFKKPNHFHFKFVVDTPDIEENVRSFYDCELRKALPGVMVTSEFVKFIDRKKQKTNPYIIAD